MTSSKHYSLARFLGAVVAVPEFVLLCFFFLVIVAIQLLLIKFGFTAVAMDQYSRLLLAADWAATPRDIISWIWLPGHTYLLGLALKLHYDLLITPFIFGIAASITVLLLMYLITRRLFNRWTALVCVLLVGLNRTFLALSLTPMVEMTYWVFLFSFLYFLIVWLENRQDTNLAIAAIGLSIAVSIRYESWFVMATFGVYLAFIWIRYYLENRSLKPAWLLSAILPAVPVIAWILVSYKHTGNPFYFASVLVQPIAKGLVGPFSDLWPYFAYLELLLLNCGLVIVPVIAGIALSRTRLGSKLWIYLGMGLIPLLMVTIQREGTIGWAFRERYSFTYFIVLMPFCAHAIWSALTYANQHGSWDSSNKPYLIRLLSVYYLWIIHQRLSGESMLLLGPLVLAGLIISFLMMRRNEWVFTSVGAAGLPIVYALQKEALSTGKETAITAAGFAVMIFIYYLILVVSYRNKENTEPNTWRLACIAFLVLFLAYNLSGAFYYYTKGREPWGAYSDTVQGLGLEIRSMYENGLLESQDKILLETHRKPKDYKVIIATSNHPANFVLDRIPFTVLGPVKRDVAHESFLTTPESSPHYTGQQGFVSDDPAAYYESRSNPLFGKTPLSIDNYLIKNAIRVIVVKDPVIEAVLKGQTSFKKIREIGGYQLYMRNSDN